MCTIVHLVTLCLSFLNPFKFTPQPNVSLIESCSLNRTSSLIAYDRNVYLCGLDFIADISLTYLFFFVTYLTNWYHFSWSEQPQQLQCCSHQRAVKAASVGDAPFCVAELQASSGLRVQGEWRRHPVQTKSGAVAKMQLFPFIFN